MSATLVPSVAGLRVIAAEVGACIRPVLQRLTDTETGDTRVVGLPCGATLATVCPSCAEKNRKLRMQQCREGWHLTDDPLAQHGVHTAESTGDQSDEDDQVDDDEQPTGRRVRSTRRRHDVPDLPRMPVAAVTVGPAYVGKKDGKTWRPSAFVTVTMPSYGKVLEDGTPVDPDSYDYRRAACDAMFMPKCWDRFAQNLRRAIGYQAQYFACVEAQKRFAPHIHAAIRGTFPRRIFERVVEATYEQLWWPHFDTPTYVDEIPAWDPSQRSYVDPHTGEPLSTWNQALDELDPAVGPAYVVRFGKQKDFQGFIAGQASDRRIGYLTKYLTKAIAQGAGDGELTPRQMAHADRLYERVRWLPCSPECTNWLRYGIQPAEAGPGMAPGYCPKAAHERARLGCGGRRVLVSRLWTGKTLTQHAEDRKNAVAAVLEAAGVAMPDVCSATELRDDGQPRWRWETLALDDPDAPSYRAALHAGITQRLLWRQQYEAARDSTGPDPCSATDHASAGSERSG